MIKDPLIFVEHIIESITNIEAFIKNVAKGYFFKNKEKQSAVIRQIEVIGEAAKNLPKEFTGKHPEIPWKDVIGMRDKLIHHYFGINLEVVWETVKTEIPILKEQMLKLKEASKAN